MLCLYSDPNICITFCKQKKKKEKDLDRSQVGENWIGRGFGAK